jgi:glycosyltransferase involved in cell wall biosynthesis
MSDPAASSSKTGCVCILPYLSGLGGPVSFQGRLIAGLQRRGIDVVHNPSDPACTAVLVIGGTRQIISVWQARRRGVRIVQRLNGMNWIHRKRPTGLRHYLRSEINNRLLAVIRRYVADRIVYQSNFARNWWQTVYGSSPAPATVIYNGIDLQVFHPGGEGEPPSDHVRLLLVEGHLRGGYEQGLDSAIKLTLFLNRSGALAVKLRVVGDVPLSMQQRFNAVAGNQVEWAGIVPQAAIPQIDRSAHLLFSADLNAACPNSVVESMACGLPVVGFATGSLPELVEGDSGRVVPYGSNYWNLEPPDITGLAGAVKEVLAGRPLFQQAARRRAEEAFGIDQMVEQYIRVLLG